MLKLLQVFRSLLLTFALTLVSLAASAQTILVSGVVKDAKGEVIIGATVMDVKSGLGTVTGVDGAYTIKVAADATLLVECMGYTEVQESVAGRTKINFVMSESAEQIEEIVMIGYGVAKKDDLTGSVVAIKAEDINRGAIVSTQDMMQGKVPGLQIIPGDGGPNSGSTIRIRGAASLNASNDPLIVIDGVPIASDAGSGMANPLSLVNPNDIESFTVLKDASAAAIYGSRASNGVIIITTKKGSGSKPSVSYNGSFSVSTNSSTMQVMTPEQFREHINTNFPEGSNARKEADKFIGTANTDWQSLIFRPALSHDHNVSIYGNSKNSKVYDELPYRASVGYTNQQGTLQTSAFDRATVDVNLSPKYLDEHLTVSINVKGVYTDQTYADGGAVGAAAFFNPTVDPYWYNEDGSIDYTTTNGFYNVGEGRGELFASNGLAGLNPLSMLYDVDKYSNTYRGLGNITFNYKVHGMEALSFNLNLGGDWSKTQEHDGVKIGSIQAYRDSDAKGFGKYTKKIWQRQNKVLDFYTNYNKSEGDHNIDAMVGYSWQHFYSADRSVTYYNETHEQYEKSTGVWGREESYLVSFYGRLNYSYASRYLLTVTLRADGSSKFAKDNRWGFFPSAAFAWNTLNEEFMQDQELFSTLKVRLGYGVTGQQEIGNYKYLARYSLSENDKSHQVIMGYENGNPIYSYMLSPSAYDPNIRWESTTTYNAGVDFGMWDGLFEGSVDVYRRDTKDLLNWVTVPMGSNFGTNLLTNVGSMRNEGVEFSLNYNPIRTATQSLRIGFNGTFQDTYFTKLNKTDDPDYAIFMNSPGTGTGGQDLQMHTVGSAPYTFYAYKQGYADGKPVQDGFYDLNGNGKIDEGDRYNTGKSPAPDFFFGVNLKYSYKNWDFGFNGHGSVGNYVFNSFYACHAATTIDARGGLGNFATTVLRTGWTKPTSEKQDRSDLYIEDASFFRLDDINIGYTFDKLGRSDIKCRVAAGVQNVFVLTKYSGVDPEVSGVAGIDGTIWPRPRIFSLRLNLNF
ncbi:MAG: TonB-dependent receptor [Tidjanibacter sp.]|nr:TonB-dependent receptor [Tidjanibacter sp.]